MSDNNKKKLHKKNKKSSIWMWVLVAVVLLVVAVAAIGSILRSSNSSTILVEVNGNQITEDDLDKEYEIFFMVSGYPEQYREIITKDMFLNQSISQVLLYNEAKNQGLALSREETVSQFEESLTTSFITKESFLQRLASTNLTYDDVISYSQTQLSVMKFMDETLFTIVVVTEAELKEYYNVNKQQFHSPEQVRAAHILVSTKEEADSIVQEIGNGKNFTDLAKKYSIDPTAKSNGGDLGYFGRGAMVEEFDYASFALPVGKITVVKTNFGFHVLKVLDKRNEGILSFDDIKGQINDTLLLEKQRKIVEEAVILLRQNAKINYIK
jgi:parvulin-like peptidyl-prolyl isomerase